MKTKFIALGIFAGMCAFITAEPASATILTVTVTGTVSGFLDPHNAGSFNDIHIGDPFKAVYSFDTTQAGSSTHNASYSEAIGGPGNNLHPEWGPFGYADVTVGNQTYSFGGYFGAIYSSTSEMLQSVQSLDGTTDTYGGFALGTDEFGAFPLDFSQPGVYDNFAHSEGELEIYNVSNGFDLYEEALFQLQRVEVSGDNYFAGDNSVPEPASLSLMTAGLMSVLLFRRRGGKR